MSDSRNNALRTRTVQSVTDSPGDDGPADGLAAARSEMDRLFAIAAEAFDSMNEHDSQDFLRNSRQTGGE